MDINYFDAQHMATNTINHHQIVDSTNQENDDIPKLLDNDTGKMIDNNIEQYIQCKDELETIPEESDEDLPVTAQDDGDTIPYIQGDSEDEQFNTAIDDTSDNPMIVMGKLLTTTFVSVNVCIPTAQVVVYKLLIISENSLANFHRNLRKKLLNRYMRYYKC